MKPTQTQARRVMIHVGESDRYKHRPLHTEILHRAHAAGLSGASVFRGTEGFGSHSIIHTSRILSLASDLPVIVVLVDDPEKIDAFLPQLDELLAQAIVIIDDVTVLHYRAQGGGG